MDKPDPAVGQIWIYKAPPGVSGHWEDRNGDKFKIVSLTEGFDDRFDIQFLRDHSFHPAGGSFPLARFRGDWEYVGTESDVDIHPVDIHPTESEASVSPAKKAISRWTLAERVIPESRLVLLYGPPGTGKTTAGNKIGLRGGEVVESAKENSSNLLSKGTIRPVFNIFNITLTEETPAAELRGHYIMKGGDFIWQDGIGITPFRNGGRLVLNEIDKASGDCLQFCHALLDDPGISAITLPTGETVRPHDDFSVVATMNGKPEDLPDALRDRFTVSVEITKPHPKAIKSLPKDLQGPCTRSYSSSATSDSSMRAITFRSWKAFGQLRESLGEDVAAAAVFGVRAATVLNTLRIGRGTEAKAGFYEAEGHPGFEIDDVADYVEFEDLISEKELDF